MLKPPIPAPLVGVLDVTTIFRRDKTMNYLVVKIVNVTILVVAATCYVLMVLQAFVDLF